MLSQIVSLVKKDFTTEFKSQERIAGVILYLFSTILVLYYSLVKVERFLWVSIFWILLIFLSINALNSSFSKEIRTRHWYYYSLVHPLAVYFSKLIFNFIWLFVLTTLSILIFKVFFDVPPLRFGLFAVTLISSTLGIACIFTFISLISGKSSDQSTVMSVLATPLIFPIMMAGSRLMMNAFGLLSDTDYSADFLSIIAIDIVAIGLSILLFPILWRD
ncbi:MAG: heme exporter protein CcmB [Saprospiraceae bacterium]